VNGLIDCGIYRQRLTKEISYQNVRSYVEKLNACYSVKEDNMKGV
jgi:hypothetical protein